MSLLLSSLRAKRGNPDFCAAAGLPRRCAPRNDESLRAFAPWRETHLLLSLRKPKATAGQPTKARRVWGAIFACLILLPSASALACSIKSPRPSARKIDREAFRSADVVIAGTVHYSFAEKRITVMPLAVRKGDRLPQYDVVYVPTEERDITTCGWADWWPSKARTRGTFYLRELSGPARRRFIISEYRQGQ